MRDFLAMSDEELAAYAATFTRGIGELALTMDLAAAQADELGSTLAEFREMIAEVNAARALQKSLMQRRDSSRKKLKTLIRNSATMLRAHEAVRDKELGMLGLKVYDRVRTASVAPKTEPHITVEIKPHRQHVVELFDFADSTVRAKPKDATGAEIWVHVGADGDAINEKNMRYVGTATRGRMICTHDAEDAGKQAFYLARWVNRRGMRGGWSNAASATIAK